MTVEVPKAIIGRREGGEPADVLEHFHVCNVCGQPVDRRDLGAVFHHEEGDHEPLPKEEAERLLSLEDRGRLALLTGTAGQRAN